MLFVESLEGFSWKGNTGVCLPSTRQLLLSCGVPGSVSLCHFLRKCDTIARLSGIFKIVCLLLQFLKVSILELFPSHFFLMCG